MQKSNTIHKKSFPGIWIRCPHLNCGNYEWLYRGRFLLYATCPSCKRNIRISSNRINYRHNLQSLVGTNRLERQMSEVQQQRADIPMTVPLSTENNIGVTIQPSRGFRKRAFCISGKIILVIHQELVERLGINEDTWIDEVEADGGISINL